MFYKTEVISSNSNPLLCEHVKKRKKLLTIDIHAPYISRASQKLKKRIILLLTKIMVARVQFTFMGIERLMQNIIFVFCHILAF